jgi:hypothetical protein
MSDVKISQQAQSFHVRTTYLDKQPNIQGKSDAGLEAELNSFFSRVPKRNFLKH